MCKVIFKLPPSNQIFQDMKHFSKKSIALSESSVYVKNTLKFDHPGLMKSAVKINLFQLRYYPIFLLLALFPNNGGHLLAQTGQSDTQSWNDIQLSAALSKKIDFNLVGTFRFGDNIRKLVDRRVAVGFTFKAGKYLLFAPSYTNISTNSPTGRGATENRLSFASTVRAPFGKLVISDRNLFERRWRAINATRYRNRLQFEHPFEIGKFAFGLFASDEVFYDWSVNHWVRNRFLVGASKPLNKRLTLDVYFMRQNDGRTHPGDLDIIGTILRIKF